MKKKNILFVSHESSLYGAQRSLLDLILNLDHELFSATVLVRAYGPLSEELQKHGICVRQSSFAWWVSKTPGPLGALNRFGRNLLAFLKIRREGWIDGIDLIYTNTSVMPFGSLLAWFFTHPHIVHVREFATEDFGLAFDIGFPLSARVMNKVSNKIVFNSDAVRNKYSKYIKTEKAVTIYNGVLDPAKYCNDFKGKNIDRSKKISICIVGSISQSKGQVRAVEALKIVLASGLDVRLHIVGTGPSSELARIKTLATNLGIEKNVIFEGYCDDVETFMKKADFSWVCSQAEAFGRVIVESMAIGTPVIAGESGGIPEIITDGETGILYPHGDIEALARRTIELTNNPEKYCAISRRAYNVAYQKFNSQRYVAEITEVISTALGYPKKINKR